MIGAWARAAGAASGPTRTNVSVVDSDIGRVVVPFARSSGCPSRYASPGSVQGFPIFKSSFPIRVWHDEVSGYMRNSGLKVKFRITRLQVLTYQDRSSYHDAGPSTDVTVV